MLSPDEPVACQTISTPEIFFSGHKRDIERAKQFCSVCLQRPACLEFALEFERTSGEHLHGIHGGLTEEQRRALTQKGNAA